MDYSQINFGMDAIVSVVFGAGGAIGVWFTLKGRVDILKVEMDNLNLKASAEINDLKKDISEADKERRELHKLVENNKNANEVAMSGIKELILQMKIDIIQEIHAKK